MLCHSRRKVKHKKGLFIIQPVKISNISHNTYYEYINIKIFCCTAVHKLYFIYLTFCFKRIMTLRISNISRNPYNNYVSNNKLRDMFLNYNILLSGTSSQEAPGTGV